MVVQRKTVLHVEDDARVSGIVAKVLAKAGFHVVTVHSAEEGLRRISQTRPDLIITDLRMPGMGGLTLLRQLATPQGTTRVPVIVFTAFEDMVDDTISRLAKGVFVKPNDLEKLPAAVAKILAETDAPAPPAQTITKFEHAAASQPAQPAAVAAPAQPQAVPPGP